MDAAPAEGTILDLLRSAWIVESARARVYQDWAENTPSFEASRTRALRRADVIARSIGDLEPDALLVGPHAAWMTALVGSSPSEVSLSELFLARLGDWVDSHAGPFLTTGLDELTALSDDEKQTLRFPETLPHPPPFEPLEPLQMGAPADIKIRVGILADLHIGSTHGATMAAAAIADLNSSGAELVVQLGDITDHGEEGEFVAAAKLLADLEMPYITMMGNHDVFAVSEQRLAGREYYERHFGRAPDGTIEEHSGFRFAALDSVEHGVSPFPPFDFVTGQFLDQKGGAVVQGGLSVPQHDLLADLAAPGTAPAFVFLHHPPQPFTSFPPLIFGLGKVDSGRLRAVCDSGHVWGIFAGHTHRNARGADYGITPIQEVGIPRDFPFGYGLLDIADTGYTYRFVQLSDPDLITEGARRASRIHRRYALGASEDRGFTWSAPGI